MRIKGQSFEPKSSSTTDLSRNGIEITDSIVWNPVTYSCPMVGEEHQPLSTGDDVIRGKLVYVCTLSYKRKLSIMGFCLSSGTRSRLPYYSEDGCCHLVTCCRWWWHTTFRQSLSVPVRINFIMSTNEQIVLLVEHPSKCRRG